VWYVVGCFTGCFTDVPRWDSRPCTLHPGALSLEPGALEPAAWRLEA